MEDIVLETIMFTKPPEWGRRVIRRGNEVLLQTTEDKGVTWIDAPIPDVKLILPELKLKNSSDNPYTGLQFISSNAIKRTLEPLKLDSELQRIIDCGALLAKRDCTDNEKSHILEQRNIAPEMRVPYKAKSIASINEKETIEAVTFLGGFRVFGLSSGQVWRDNQNYLRCVP